MSLTEARSILADFELRLSSVSANSSYQGSYMIAMNEAQRVYDALVTVREETDGLYADFDNLAERIRDSIMRESYEIAEGISETVIDAMREKFKGNAGR